MNSNGCQEANARLISAAPELLAVVEKIELLNVKAERDQLEDWADYGACVYLLSGELRSALAKARE